jgi:hypothetical protein
MTDAEPKRRWFRFSLRTLLVVVTLAALGSWAYWIGWPWWLIHREQMKAESAAKQLKPGMTLDEAGKILNASCGGLRVMHYQTACEDSGKGYAICHGAVHFETSNADYIAFFEYERGHADLPNAVFKTVEVFRLPTVPTNYQPRTARGRSSLDQYPPGHPADSPLDMYMEDFFVFLSGDRKTNPGVQYELIYSDPPAKPAN